MIVVRQGDAHAATVAIGVLGELGVAAVEGPPLLVGLEQVVGKEAYQQLVAEQRAGKAHVEATRGTYAEQLVALERTVRQVDEEPGVLTYVEAVVSTETEVGLGGLRDDVDRPAA